MLIEVFHLSFMYVSIVLYHKTKPRSCHAAVVSMNISRHFELSILCITLNIQSESSPSQHLIDSSYLLLHDRSKMQWSPDCEQTIVRVQSWPICYREVIAHTDAATSGVCNPATCSLCLVRWYSLSRDTTILASYVFFVFLKPRLDSIGGTTFKMLPAVKYYFFFVLPKSTGESCRCIVVVNEHFDVRHHSKACWVDQSRSRAIMNGVKKCEERSLPLKTSD